MDDITQQLRDPCRWGNSHDRERAATEIDTLRQRVKELEEALGSAAAELELAAQKIINIHTLLSRGLFEAADRARRVLSGAKK